MEKEEYIKYLSNKGILCTQKRTCNGCFAFSKFTRDEVVGEDGWADEKLTDDELLQLGFYGNCELGFDQKWYEWGIAVPLDSCPKPKSKKLYFRCIGKID